MNKIKIELPKYKEVKLKDLIQECGTLYFCLPDFSTVYILTKWPHSSNKLPLENYGFLCIDLSNGTLENLCDIRNVIPVYPKDGSIVFKYECS